MLGKTYQGDFSPRDRKEYLQDYVHGVFEPGGEMVFPLPKGATALTAPGDPVLAGQVLSEGGIPVHCSCSGTVKAVEVRSTARGDALCVVVENDKRFRAAEGVGVKTDWQEMPRSEILRRIDAAGALAVDEQRFPSALKLTSLGPDAVSRVVVDGTDAEPIASSDTDILRTRGYGVAQGIRIALRLFPGAEGLVLIREDNVKTMTKMDEALSGSGGIDVLPVRADSCPGDEAATAALLSGTKEKGSCLVLSPAAAFAIYEAVCLSTPVIRKIVTVAGTAVKNPGNYLVRVGTGCAELINAAGGLKAGAAVKKAVLGGALTGTAVRSLDIPFPKDCGALLLFAEDEAEEAAAQATECIRCGRCARACPVGLMPMLMAKAAEKCDLKRYEKELYGRECTLCGQCALVCPAKRPLTDMFRYAGGLVGSARK